MQITISFPDDIGRHIRQLPDTDWFVSTLVAQALESWPDFPQKENNGGPEKILDDLAGCLGSEPAEHYDFNLKAHDLYGIG